MDDTDFDDWNGLKKKLEGADARKDNLPQEGEVWICILGTNLGSEQNGKGYKFSRPVLVIKKFNAGLFWIIPMSSKQKSMDFYFNFTDPFGRKVSAIIMQLRIVSIKRFRRKAYDMPSSILTAIKLRLMSFL